MVAGGSRWIESGFGGLHAPGGAATQRAQGARAQPHRQPRSAATSAARCSGDDRRDHGFLVLTILGVPFAAPLALLMFFFDLIPLVGATLAAVLVAIVTLFVNFPVALIVWVIFSIAYQQVRTT